MSQHSNARLWRAKAVVCQAKRQVDSRAYDASVFPSHPSEISNPQQSQISNAVSRFVGVIPRAGAPHVGFTCASLRRTLPIMAKAKSNHEIEIKLRIKDVPALCRRLKQLSARTISPASYERNTLYDTPKKDLARHDQLIRIRIEQPRSHGGRRRRPLPTKTILTYKGPAQAAARGRHAIGAPKKESRYKVKQELEVSISDGEQMGRILAALGLRPSFRYEKIRTTYVLPRIQNLKIEFDETPIGPFLELEGGTSAIDRVAKLLGFSHSDYITETYGTLYIEHSRNRGRNPTDMLFSPTKKLP
jgi:adenylate cyclase, class 2